MCTAALDDEYEKVSMPGGVRPFTDPVLMMRLGAQALDLIEATARGMLEGEKVNWADDHAITVVMAAKGYPNKYQKGSVIGGLEVLPKDTKNMCFHAGTKAHSSIISRWTNCGNCPDVFSDC